MTGKPVVADGETPLVESDLLCRFAEPPRVRFTPRVVEVTPGAEDARDGRSVVEQPEALAMQTCGICGDDYDPRFSRAGICFTCSVHAVCACGDPPDR